MFNDNKYTETWYAAITERGQIRELDSDTERHHIIPKSLGGSNNISNLTCLTTREHFICHWLLIKMTEGESRAKMLYALQGMKAENRYQQRYSSAITARVYERHRKEHAKNHSERMKGKEPWNKGGVEITDEHRANLVQAALHRAPKSEHTIQKWKESRAGYKHTDETKLKQSLASKGKLKGPMTEEHKAAISAGGKGIKKHEGHGDKVRQANIGNVSINKDGAEKKVKRDTLDQWLVDGWSLGGKKRKQL
jgi:hypothetical protein